MQDCSLFSVSNVQCFKSFIYMHGLSLISAFLSLTPPPAGCATNFLVTVVTSTSWSVIITVASTNITESGAPMLSPSRCSRCVGSSNETCGILSHPLSLPPPAPPPLPSFLHPVIPALPGASSSRCSQHFCSFLLPTENKRRWLNEWKGEENSLWGKADDWCPTDGGRWWCQLDSFPRFSWR